MMASHEIGGATTPAASTLARIDWRFLLPDPSLRRAGFAGDVDPQLATAVEHLRCSVGSGSSPEESWSEESGHGVMVVSAPTQALLKQAFQRLAPGGWLYCELGRPGLGRARILRHVAEVGFQQIRVHWHHPDFHRCRQILPLGDRNALSYYLAHQRRWYRRLGAAVLRELSGSGLACLVPSVSVTAQRPPVGPLGLNGSTP